jgi:glycosyltransferase involved in cell wall biosynthesis
LDEEKLCESDKRNITFRPIKTSGAKSDKIAGAPHISDTVNESNIDILLIPGGIKTGMMKYIRQNTRCRIVVPLHSMPLWHIKDYFENRRHKARCAGFWKTAELYMLRAPREFLTGRHKRGILEQYKTDYRNSDLYTVLCEPYKESLIEVLGPKLATTDKNHIEVFPNCIQPREYGVTEKKKRVLYLGRLSFADKRVDRLLDIWALVHRDFPDWELCVVGDGAEKERLMQRSEKLGLTNIEFCNYTLNPEQYYREASIICMTSTYEGWPLALAEGQQAGVIPIAFDVCAGIREQLSPSGANGILVKPFDKKAYARELARLMSDDNLREEMSRNVVAQSKKYSDVSRLAKWDEAFRKLLK